MKTSKQWIQYFRSNAGEQRVDWSLTPGISEKEMKTIVPSLQAWQLGETSDGKHLLRAASAYARRTGDPDYLGAVELFIKEEQKHGSNLGRYLDAIGQPRVKSDWGDTLFRKVRYFNTSMELWTLAVIVVESTAQIFYQSLKDATGCKLLKQICTDILIDEAEHINFQAERLSVIYNSKRSFGRAVSDKLYGWFFFATAMVVWVGHRKLFLAGGVDFDRFMHKMDYKYNRIVSRLTEIQSSAPAAVVSTPAYVS